MTMTLHYGFENFPTNISTVVTIGSFDGVHSGHRELVAHLRAMAERMGAESVIVTFDPHPRIAMGRAEGMGLLTTIEERATLLAMLGVDHLVVAHFDEKFRMQSYADFVRCSLVEKLNMVGMIVGYNHRLGRSSEGNYDNLQPLSRECGFALECVGQYCAEGHKTSSTEVRKVIARGDMELAATMLGYRYLVQGGACNGVLEVGEHKLLPPVATYPVTIYHLDKTESATVTVSGRTILFEKPLSGDIILEM